MGGDVATLCDGCGADIAYGVTCYAPRTGETIDDLPVVRIVCASCHGGPDAVRPVDPDEG